MAQPSPPAPPPTLEDLNRAQRKFARDIKAFEATGGHYIDRGLALEPRHVQGCEVFATRYEILDRLPKGGVVAEVGTDTGDFAKAILERTSPSKLHVLDIAMDRMRPDTRAAFDADARVSLHEGDSSTLLSNFPPSTFDWIYIDGDHYYDGVKKDLDAALKVLKPDGMLIFNDYTAWSVGSMSRCGVVRAVNELCVKQGWRFKYFSFQGLMYCDVALERIPA